jgi:hypothetical protein
VTIEAELHDGRVLEFPDGTAPEVVQATVKRMLGPAPSSNTAVLKNALYKGAASIPDTLLNAPNNLMNLGKAAYGVATGQGADAPEPTPNPDLARRGLEAVGLIDPNVVPRGAVQKAIDYGGQGAVGGALTGGASLVRSATGAVMGALSGEAAGATHELTGNPALTAAAGLVAPAGAAKVLGGGVKLSPQAQLLADEGVSLTPGQIKGGAIRRAEDAATSIPVLGDSIKAAQRRGIESFDTAAINRSLEPIGAKLPANLKGNQAIEYAYGKLGDAYDNLLPSLKGDLNAVPGAGALPKTAGQAAPPSFKQELDNIRQMAQNLPEPQRGQVGRIIDREIVDRFTAQGKASGETLKEVESKLGVLSKKFRQSEDYDTRTMGDAVTEMQNAMRRMVENVNPAHQGQLAKINEGYANFKKVQNAAGKVGANEGVFTPAQLHNAVRAGDTSKDKARFAEGNALMQDLSGAGKAVLPSTVPDSGTPFRAAMMYALSHPLYAAAAGIPIGLGAAAYSRPGQYLAQRLMTNPRPMLGEVASQASGPATAGVLQDILRQQKMKEGRP